MKNFMKLSDRRIKSIFRKSDKLYSSIYRISFLLATLSMQACVTEPSTNSVSTNGGTRSNLKVKTLFGGQGHIEKDSIVYITHTANNKISEIKFQKPSAGNKSYTFKVTKIKVFNSKRERRLNSRFPRPSNSIRKQGINYIYIHGIQSIDDAAINGDGRHKIFAALVKIGDKYVAIDFDYWDTSHKANFIGHGRGGGGGWN